MPQQGQAQVELDAAIKHLLHLKTEHAPILTQLAADSGIEVQTRRLLVEHLLEEEADAVQALVQARQPQTPAAPAPAAPQLTVGSLRDLTEH